MQHKYIRWILFAGVALALAGCGSSRSEEEAFQGVEPPAFGVDVDGIPYIGADRCISCHAGLTTGREEVIAYLAGPHLVHDTAIDAAASDSCLSCHDPIGDGRTLERYVDPAQIPAAGLAAVGCESCHGAGGEHFGLEPVPNPTPDFTLCGNCHTALPTGPAGHAGGSAGGVFADYAAGGHSDTYPGGAVIALCSRCHSHEGFRSLAGQTAGLDGQQLAIALAGATPPETATSVQCLTCHDSHSGALRAAATTSVQGSATLIEFSAQFNLCTTCHQVFLDTSFDAGSQTFTYQLNRNRTPFHGTSGDPAADSNRRLIWDTHFASAVDGIAGYGVEPAAADACSRCHDPHRAQ